MKIYGKHSKQTLKVTTQSETMASLKNNQSHP